MNRAYSLIEVKSVDEDQRVITGIATTPSTDRMGDIVDPKGADFKLPIPLLWQHNAREPIGEVFAATVTSKGIEIKARIVKIDEAGKLKDRIDEAWQSLKTGLVKGLSIGFQAIESEAINPKEPWGALRFVKWLWLELSAVTIPANADATILAVKSHDIGAPAASGTERTESTLKPGVSGKSTVVKALTKDNPMKTIQEQITSFEATRQAKSAEITAIMNTSAEAGATLDEAQAEKHDTLSAEIKSIDEHLKRLRDHEELNKAGAVKVDGTTQEKAGASRAGQHQVSVRRELPPGILFARYAMCVGASKGVPVEAMRLAKEHYPDDPGVLKLVEKTAVTGGATTGSHYLDDMVPYNVMQDFIEYLRPGSIIGKFGGPNPGGGGNYPALNKVGFNQRVSGMSTGYSAAWKGEGLPAIPSAAITFNTTLGYANLAALAVLTKEAIRFSNPSAEMKVRDDLARAVNAKMDLDFVDPANLGTANLKPASIIANVVATAPTGTTAAYFRTNLATMIATFAAANLSPEDIVLIMSATQALQLSMMVNTLGNNDFPDLTMKGGSCRGFPVIVSEHLTAVGSPSTQTIIAVKASDVYLADDGVVTVEASDQASIEMVDASSASAISGTGASLVSLWQLGAVGLMATREITWKLRRSTAARYISPAAYVA